MLKREIPGISSNGTYDAVQQQGSNTGWSEFLCRNMELCLLDVSQKQTIPHHSRQETLLAAVLTISDIMVCGCNTHRVSLRVSGREEVLTFM